MTIVTTTYAGMIFQQSLTTCSGLLFKQPEPKFYVKIQDNSL